MKARSTSGASIVGPGALAFLLSCNFLSVAKADGIAVGSVPVRLASNGKPASTEGRVATCEITKSARHGVRGVLRVSGRAQDGAAVMTPLLRLDFTFAGLPASALSKPELDADFSWYGEWEGPRDWPNLSVYPLPDGTIRTPMIDEREMDMIAAAKRVILHVAVAGKDYQREYVMGDFARSFTHCRRQLTVLLENQLAKGAGVKPGGR